jgi:putative MATE family efflux protein
VPLTVAQLVQLLYNVVDRIYLGHMGDGNSLALTGVGLTFPIVTLIMAFTALFGMGGVPLFSMARGDKDDEKASRILGNSFGLLIMSAVVLTALCLVFRRPILFAFGASEASYGYADEYLKIYLFGTAFSMLTTGMNGFINAQGFPRIGMLTTVVGAVINIVLDPVFIFVFKMGVQGAAWATVISRYVEFGIVAVWTHCNGKAHPFICGAFRSLHIPGKLLKDILKKGSPLLLNEFLWACSMAIMNQCYSTCGLNVVPAMNISSTMYNLGSVVYIAMGSAVGIIMGQLLGAGEPEPVIRDNNRKLITAGVISGVIFGGLMLSISGVFPMLYNTDEEVRQLAARLICISAIMLPMHSYTHATYFTLRSGGQTMVTFLFDSCFQWLVCVPVGFCLSRFTAISILPLYFACQSTDVLKSFLGYWMLKQGKWIRNLTN